MLTGAQALRPFLEAARRKPDWCVLLTPAQWKLSLRANAQCEVPSWASEHVVGRCGGSYRLCGGGAPWGESSAFN